MKHTQLKKSIRETMMVDDENIDFGDIQTSKGSYKLRGYEEKDEDSTAMFYHLLNPQGKRIEVPHALFHKDMRSDLRGYPDKKDILSIKNWIESGMQKINENKINNSELKSLIRETVEEVMQEFAPLGVAEERLDEKAPPGFPKKLQDKLLNQYKGDEEKAYGTMWKIFYAKKNGHKKIDEMWTAFENAGMNEQEDAPSEEGGEVDQNADHDETDLSNPEEKEEVQLAKQIKELAEKLLAMHGVSEEGEAEEGGEEGEEAGEEETEEQPAQLTEKRKKSKKK